MNWLPCAFVTMLWSVSITMILLTGVAHATRGGENGIRSTGSTEIISEHVEGHELDNAGIAAWTDVHKGERAETTEIASQLFNNSHHEVANGFKVELTFSYDAATERDITARIRHNNVSNILLILHSAFGSNEISRRTASGIYGGKATCSILNAQQELDIVFSQQGKQGEIRSRPDIPTTFEQAVAIEKFQRTPGSSKNKEAETLN